MAQDNLLSIQLNLLGVQASVDGLRQVTAAMSQLGNISAAFEQFQGARGTGDTAHAKAAFRAMAAESGAALKILGTAFGLMTAAAISSANQLLDFARMKNALGGNAGATSVLREFGGAFGFNGGSVANRLMGASTGGGLGTFAAMQLGVGPTPQALALSGRPIDKAGMAAGAMQRLGQIIDTQGKNAALATLQLAGLDEELGFLVELSKRDREEFTAYARERAKEFSSDRIQKAAHFQMELQKLKDSFSDLTLELGSKLSPLVELVIKALGALTRVIKGWFAEIVIATGGIMTLRGILSTNLKDVLLGSFITAFGISMRLSADAVDRNTNAVDRNTSQMSNFIGAINGIFGGGQRARGAIPAAFGPGNGIAFDRYLQSDMAIRWGAYSISL